MFLDDIDEPVVAVDALAAELDLKGYVWRGWSAEQAPEPGEEAWWGSFGHPFTGESGDYWGVPYVVWGDYIGTTVDRANYNVLCDEWAQHVVVVTGGYNSHSLFLKGGADIPEALAECLRGLRDYPLISDDELAQVELGIQASDWDQYGSAEALESLKIAAEDSGELEELGAHFERLGGDSHALAKLYFKALDVAGLQILHEDAVNAWFPDVSETMLDLLREEAVLIPEIPGQLKISV